MIYDLKVQNDDPKTTTVKTSDFFEENIKLSLLKIRCINRERSKAPTAVVAKK